MCVCTFFFLSQTEDVDFVFCPVVLLRGGGGGGGGIWENIDFVFSPN